VRACLPGLALWPLLLVTAFVYWPGLYGPVLLDDYTNLEPLVAMQAGALSWQEVLASRPAGFGGRPVAMLSFLGNWLATGGDVFSLKHTNLMIHLLCGVLLFWLSGRLLGEGLTRVEQRRWWLALWVTALWLLAPMLVSTVLYVVQRMAQLATLFTLSGLLCYVIGRQHLAERRSVALGFMALCFVVFWPLATLSKQNGALLPLLAAAVEFGFFQRPPEHRRLVHGVLLATIALPALGALIKLALDPGWLGGSFAAREFSLYERVLTQPRILFDYVANLLLIPGGTPLGLYHDDYVKSVGPLKPVTTIIAIIAWVAMLIAAWRLRASDWRPLLFGPLFFLAAHLLESTVLPLELYFEHRNYLPGIGIYLALAVAAGRLLQAARVKKLLTVVLVLIPLGFGIVTAHRVLIWETREGLLLASQRSHPESPRVHTGLASLYLDGGELERGLTHLDRAEVIYGGRRSYAIALHRLAAQCLSHAPAPERHYVLLEGLGKIADDVYTINTLQWLAESAERGACRNLDLARIVGALHQDVRALEGAGVRGRNWALKLHAARLLALEGRRREAVAPLQAAAALRPGWLEPGLLALRYQLEMGDVEGARRTLAELKRQDRGTLRLHTRLIEEFERRLN
jgi:hypothetical protein